MFFILSTFSDKGNGKLALICELMDMNLYEMIRGMEALYNIVNNCCFTCHLRHKHISIAFACQNFSFAFKLKSNHKFQQGNAPNEFT